MLLNPEMLSTSKYQQPTKSLNKVKVNESYFSMAVKVIEEMSNIGYNNEKALYRSVLEAGESTYFINESFAEFKEKVKEIIHKFIELIKSLAARFITSMNSIVKSDKYLKKHKDDIYNFSSEDKFKMNLYNFSNIDNDKVPATSAYKELTGISIPEIKYQDKAELTGDFLSDQIKCHYDNSKGSINSFYKEFRGKVLGRNASYDEAEYNNELFSFYHGGEKDKKEVEVDREWVVNAYQRFVDYEKVLSQIKKIRDDLEKEYKAIENEVKNTPIQDDNMLRLIYNNTSEEDLAILEPSYREGKKKIDVHVDLIEKLKVEKIQNMCKIHALAFATKLDAIKECYKQDKAVLYKALNKTQKVHESSILLIDEQVDSYDIYEYEYNNLLLSEAANQQKLITALQEADYLSLGVIPIQESVVDVIKAGVQKIIAILKKLWGKFIGKAAEFVQTDKAWLDNNKKVILNQPWKSRDVEVYIYDEAGLTGDKFKVPPFDYEKFKGIALADDKNAEYIKTYFPTALKSNEELREQIINLLRSDDMKEMDIARLDKQAMYKFCINYETIAKNMNKDLVVIEQAQATLNTEIGKVEKELLVKQQEEAKAKEAQQQNNNNDSDLAKEAQKANADAEKAQAEVDKAKEQNNAPKNESYVSLYESVVYLNEAGPKIGKLKTDNNSGNSNDTTIKGANINTGARDTGLDSSTASAAANAAASGSDTDSKLNELDKIKEGVSAYFKLDADIILAKLTVCQKMYKDYMALLRAHVESYAGEGKNKK